MQRILIFLFLLFFPVTSWAAEISVHDGDTFKIDGVKIRLWGIDAPEMKQSCQKDEKPYACGKAAKLALESFINARDEMGARGEVACQVLDIDRYKRKIARCTLEGADLGRMMVRLGYAVEYEQYSKGFYMDAQEEAVAAKRGLWAMEFQNPWDWRRAHR
jgi:endonuclease YncB( thermonuclease family)